MLVGRRLSAREARAKFSDLLNQVHYTREPVIIEKKGKPFAAVIDLEEYERFRKAQEQAFAVLDRIRERNADKTPEEVEQDVTAEVEAVRRDMYEQRKATESRR